jgi:transketolase
MAPATGQTVERNSREGALDPPTLRRLVLEQARSAGVGHIGPALSIVEILAVLFGGVLRGTGTADPDRDRFVLSKGHAAMALYAALNQVGLLSSDALRTYCADGTLLGVHPEHALPGVEFSTGSLGHGLSIGAGAALGARLRSSPARVFVLLSDAELNEGSVWEAVMFAAHHRLARLVAIVDDNRQQAFGKTCDVLDLQPVAAKWAAFGWEAHDVDGHDLTALRRALAPRADSGAEGRPLVLVAHTTAGKAVSFMEGRVEWHYLPMNDEQYATALAEVAQDTGPAAGDDRSDVATDDRT